MPDSLLVGREAIQRHDWATALEALTEFDAEEGLSPDDLMMLGDAYWWTGHADDALEVFERAFGAYVREDRVADAAATGALLAYFAIRRQSLSIAGAWIARVEDLLEGQPVSIGHAWLNLLYVGFALFVEVNLDLAISKSTEAIDLAKELRLPGVQSLAMSFQGIALVQKGEWREGLALIDEASVVAMTEGSDLRAVSDVYCNTIAACANLGDYRRASEWTEEADRWMSSNSVGGYTGICQVHRAELKRLRGSWSEAEEAARNACIELERFRLMDGIGFAYYEIGEVRRRMGDLDAAEEAFQVAYEYGHGSQPGYSLLLLDRGDVDAAVKSIGGALDRRSGGEASTGSLSRARLLPAQVEISMAAGDLETARKALEELKDVAENYDNSLWSAYALACEGSVELAEGHVEKALAVLNKSWLLWRDSDMPYESAKARVLLGMARQAAGDEGGAQREFLAARSSFQKLGAHLDLEHLARLTGEEIGRSRADGHRVTKTFMFTDIVTSTDLIGIIGDSAWQDLLKWHDRTLQKAFGDHAGDVVRHTGDGFFVTFDDARSGVECGVEIQRRLEKHRRDHGFSPWVRIGLHEAEATKEQNDYSGRGVHFAARVGALADREEILVSAAVLEAAGDINYRTSKPRTVTLKGISEPVDVYSIEWRRS